MKLKEFYQIVNRLSEVKRVSPSNMSIHYSTGFQMAANIFAFCQKINIVAITIRHWQKKYNSLTWAILFTFKGFLGLFPNQTILGIQLDLITILSKNLIATSMGNNILFIIYKGKTGKVLMQCTV